MNYNYIIYENFAKNVRIIFDGIEGQRGLIFF